MERTFDGYVKEVDESIETAFCEKNVGKYRTDGSALINELRPKYSHLPDKWRTELQQHIIKSITLKHKEVNLKEFNRRKEQEWSFFCGNDIGQIHCAIVDLMENLEKLKNQVGNLLEDNNSLREDLKNQMAINVILQTNLNTVQSEIRYFKKNSQDPNVPVGIIQRYWKSYLLRRNVKFLAKQYEEQMLQEFRKNLLKGVSKSKICEAADTLPKKLKPCPSDPCEWTERKARQVASDWLS